MWRGPSLLQIYKTALLSGIPRTQNLPDRRGVSLGGADSRWPPASNSAMYTSDCCSSVLRASSFLVSGNRDSSTSVPWPRTTIDNVCLVVTFGYVCLVRNLNMRRRPCRKQLPELNLLMKSDTRSARSTSTALTMLPYVRLCMGATSSISVQTDAQRLTRNPACWLIPPDAASCGFNGGAVTTKIANGFSITTTASEFHRTGEVILPEQCDATAHLPRKARVSPLPLFYWGLWLLLIGLGIYFAAISLSILRLALIHQNLFVGLIAKLLWVSGFPTTVGFILIAVDLAAYFPRKRRGIHRVSAPLSGNPMITVALTAYNDELSIAAAVQDFLSHPLVKVCHRRQ